MQETQEEQRSTATRFTIVTTYESQGEMRESRASNDDPMLLHALMTRNEKFLGRYEAAHKAIGGEIMSIRLVQETEIELYAANEPLAG